MKFIENIKNSLGKRKIEKILKVNTRKVKVSNFSNAKSIGIVYKVSTTDYQHVVNNYIDFLREEIGFKKIVSLGFCDRKETPNFINNESMKFQYFNKTDLSRFNLAISENALDFMECEFDILIDLSNEFVTPIKHLVASSNAKFKIGRYSMENKPYYDFMVELDKQAPARMFIEQVNTFLKQVKPK